MYQSKLFLRVIISNTISFHSRGFLEPYGFLQGNSLFENQIFRSNMTIDQPGESRDNIFLDKLCYYYINNNCIERERYESAKSEVNIIENWLLSTYKGNDLPPLYSKKDTTHVVISICIYNELFCIYKMVDNYAAEERYSMKCTTGFDLPRDICNVGEISYHEDL